MNDSKYGPQVLDDDDFKRQCRLLQSRYRVEVLKQSECGPYKRGGYVVGSVLVDGEATGANFIGLAARACAWEKLAEKNLVNPDLTVDRYRLFNNMLSSQPMCINLFAALRLGIQHQQPNACKVVAAMFQDLPIGTVAQLEIEMLPQPKRDYICDKTAFDAALIFFDSAGRKCLASIETKYTDKLGGNAASEEKRQKEIAGELKLFSDEGCKWYAEHCLDQVIRNLLLTLVYRDKHELGMARNYVLAPEKDLGTCALIDSVKGRLAPQYRDCIEFLSLDEVVRRGLAVADTFFKDHLRRFHERYLDFGQIEHQPSCN